MHTLLLGSDQMSDSLWKFHKSTQGFSEQIRKVAVSCHNCIALVQHRQLVLLAANHPNQSAIKLLGEQDGIRIHDVAFSQDGDYLYVSGTQPHCIVLVYNVVLDNNQRVGSKRLAAPIYKIVSSPWLKTRKKKEKEKENERKRQFNCPTMGCPCRWPI